MNKQYVEGVQNNKTYLIRVGERAVWLYCSLAGVRDNISVVQRPKTKRD